MVLGMAVPPLNDYYCQIPKSSKNTHFSHKLVPPIYILIEMVACFQYHALHVRPGYHEECDNYPDRYRGRNILVSWALYYTFVH